MGVRSIPGAILQLICSASILLLPACNNEGKRFADNGHGSGERIRVPVLADVTGSAGLATFRHTTGAYGERLFPESMGGGCGFLDIDADGHLDIAVVTGNYWSGYGPELPVVTLYRNRGDGSFEDVTAEAGVNDVSGYGMGLAVADYDNDGDTDLYVSTLRRDRLLRNDGGTFTEVGTAAGVGARETWTMSAMFFDVDRDGWLDLLVAGYVKWTPESDLYCSIDGKNRTYCRPDLYEGEQPVFYHNNGDGTFSDWTERAGFVPSPGKSLGLAEFDFDEDGWVDVLISNDTQPDQLFHNLGDGTFEEVGLISGIAFDESGNARGGMGVDTGYLDDSGDVTTVVANFAMEMIGVYRHLGNGLFIDRAAISRIGRPSLLTLAFGLFVVDFDLDGDLDLFAANGHIHPDVEKTIEGITYAQAPHLFVNDGDGAFRDIGPEVGGVLGERIVARGAAHGDYDNDGDPDLLVAENDGPLHLWRNDTDTGAYLVVRLEGTTSNRDGIGARLTASVGERQLIRRMRSGSSYLSASELSVRFGLGDEQIVRTLEISWPSGLAERWSNIQGNQMIKLREGSGSEVSVDKAALR